MENLKDIVLLSAENNCKIRFRVDKYNNILFKCSCFLNVRDASALIEILKAMQNIADAEKNPIGPLDWLKGNFRSAGIEFQGKNNLITVKYKTWIMALKNALK